MHSKINKILYNLFTLERLEVFKLFMGGVLFFAIVGANTITQELKLGIFSTIIGPYQIPVAKFISVLLLIPFVILDGYLVDQFKRHNLLMLYTFIFGFIGLIFTYLISHPEIGLANTQPSIDRMFGWTFFFYVEAFTPFLIGVFWALMNSMHNPQNAQKTYGFIVSMSKLGGILVTMISYLFLANNNLSVLKIEGVRKIQIIMLVAALLLLFASAFLALMFKKLDISTLQGYSIEESKTKNQKTGVWMGIKLLVTNKYVSGIFLLIFLSDIMSECISFKRILLMSKNRPVDSTLSDMLAQLYLQLSYMHSIGLGISLFLTNGLLRFFGTRFCVFIMPVMTLLFVVTYLISGTDTVIIWLYILFRALHYTIGTPVRESLYIVTSKDIQFKAKFVIDAIGSKAAKGTGQCLNYIVTILNKFYGQFTAAFVNNIVFIIVPMLWILVTYLISNAYHDTIKKNKFIM